VGDDTTLTSQQAVDTIFSGPPVLDHRVPVQPGESEQ
jgi:hypothetical protein